MKDSMTWMKDSMTWIWIAKEDKRWILRSELLLVDQFNMKIFVYIVEFASFGPICHSKCNSRLITMYDSKNPMYQR